MNIGSQLDTWSAAGGLVEEQIAIERYDLRARLNCYLEGQRDPADQVSVRVIDGDLEVDGHLLLDWKQGLAAVGLIVIGEYNDGTLRFDGTLSVPVALSHDHDFVIMGGLKGRWLDPCNEGHSWSAVLHPSIPLSRDENGAEEYLEIDSHLVPRLMANEPVLRADLPPAEHYPFARTAPDSSLEELPANRFVPVQLRRLPRGKAAACGTVHSVVLTPDRAVWAWGSNHAGQLGNGTTTDSAAGVQVDKLADVMAIACGSSHNLAVRSGGTVWDWG